MRFDKDSFHEIADTLTRNKSRSFLTGFGIFWGIFMLLTLIGGGQGLKELLSKNFEGFASNLNNANQKKEFQKLIKDYKISFSTLAQRLEAK